MHELGIAMSLLEIVKTTAISNNLNRVTSVIVQAGELTALEPATLMFCFDEIKKESLANDARLEVEIVPLAALCPQCEKEFKIENLQFACPTCDNKDIKVISGEEIILYQLDGEK